MIQIAQHRNEIRDQVYRGQRIGGDDSNALCILGDARNAGRNPKRHKSPLRERAMR